MPPAKQIRSLTGYFVSLSSRHCYLWPPVMVFIFVQGPTCRQPGFVYVFGLVFIWGSRGGAQASCSLPSMTRVAWQSLQAPNASRWGDACSRLTPLLPPACPTCSPPPSLMKGTVSGSLSPGLNSEIEDACRVLFYGPELEGVTLTFTVDCISLLSPPSVPHLWSRELQKPALWQRSWRHQQDPHVPAGPL